MVFTLNVFNWKYHGRVVSLVEIFEWNVNVLLLLLLYKNTDINMKGNKRDWNTMRRPYDVTDWSEILLFGANYFTVKEFYSCSIDRSPIPFQCFTLRHTFSDGVTPSGLFMMITFMRFPVDISVAYLLTFFNWNFTIIIHIVLVSEIFARAARIFFSINEYFNKVLHKVLHMQLLKF